MAATTAIQAMRRTEIVCTGPCSSMRIDSDSTCMTERGQGNERRSPAACERLDDHGYIMVVLLVGMAVSAIWMTALLPSWRQQTQREREADLIFRGEQYARAIALSWRR